ncbi:PREDICTED: probable FBD-associated F-box protein At1g32375 [Camelina sativa]|uniref:Probable FBD-associated F-box protein At1g32375 n=1 Tax=Camelina sativa TaxID=90675 RepID=A0ABM0V5K1_CAMSA|nr:PREDICTED: probable FBD-associated F-box protein At1g32375 [Camelina sativa]
MDSISQLPEALLLRILSLLPAKDFVATMVLSKRWQLLWKLVPKLIYDDSYQNIEYGKFSRFVDRSLLLHEAPVIETLHFKLGRKCDAVDISVWTGTAVKRCVRYLIVEIDCSSSTTPVILPVSLYTGCTMLVTLKLNSVVIVDISSLVSFPSLKTLSLLFVKYPNDGFVKRLLSNCPVLEALVVERDPNDNVTIFTVIVHSLKSLFLRESPKSVDNSRGFVVDAPSLECFDVLDHKGGFCIIENDMPKIVTANVDVTYILPGKILGSITSVKRLYLCLSTSKTAYPVGSVLHRLVNLRLCTCETEWLNLLMCLLRDSPKLRVLKLEQKHTHQPDKARPSWSEPSSIPECVISSLETLEWVKYEGTEEEKDVSAFILRNAKCLKMATISSNSTDPNKKLKMLKELSSSPRRSPTCQLIFD